MELVPSKVKYIFDGEIHYDEQNEGNMPLLKMANGSYSWEDLGKYLMTYEGFKIKIEIID